MTTGNLEEQVPYENLVKHGNAYFSWFRDASANHTPRDLQQQIVKNSGENFNIYKAGSLWWNRGKGMAVAIMNIQESSAKYQ